MDALNNGRVISYTHTINMDINAIYINIEDFSIFGMMKNW